MLVVLSDESSGYAAVAEELRAGLAPLREGRLRIDMLTAARLRSVDATTFGAYELVVTVGLAAAQASLARGTDGPPTLCLLIPRQSFEHLAASRKDASERLSALFIDQPLSRQLDLVRAALPERRRIGVILGPSSRELSEELRREASTRTLTLNLANVEQRSGVYGALQTVMAQSDLLLLLPDPTATNADTVYGLLLTTYRAQVPVVGFSEGLLNAGALLSLYSTASQQGRQGAQIASRALAQGGVLPAPQYPQYFTVRVNASVARSLGLHLPSEATLDAELGKLEERGASLPAPPADNAAASEAKP